MNRRAHVYCIGDRVGVLDQRGRVLFTGTVQFVRPDGEVNVMRDRTGSIQTVRMAQLKLIRGIPEELD